MGAVRAVGRHRHWLGDRYDLVQTAWLDFRERIGRSVAKSKRREIAELRAEVVRLRSQVSAVALRVELMEAAEAEREAFEQIRRRFSD